MYNGNWKHRRYKNKAEQFQLCLGIPTLSSSIWELCKFPLCSEQVISCLFRSSIETWLLGNQAHQTPWLSLSFCNLLSLVPPPPPTHTHTLSLDPGLSHIIWLSGSGSVGTFPLPGRKMECWSSSYPFPPKLLLFSLITLVCPLSFLPQTQTTSWG